MNVSKAEFGDMKPLGRIMAASFQNAFADFVLQQTVLAECLDRIGNQPVFLWAFKGINAPGASMKSTVSAGMARSVSASLTVHWKCGM